MPLYLFRVAARALLALMLGMATTAASAGPLNPPAGPVAPTYKTLGELEPRTPVGSTTTPGDSACLYRITQPGSYYLTGNIIGEAGKHGIIIAADGVTLDLNGFRLIGASDTLNGISMPQFRVNVVIRNGHVLGWGGSGIQSRIDAGRIEGVTACSNGGWGIDNAVSGTFTTHITGCEAIDNAQGGIRGSTVSLIDHCVTRNNGGFGISVGRASIVTGCTSALDIGGISTDLGSTIRGNNIYGARTADGHGIRAIGESNRIEDNHIAFCGGAGIRTEAGNNFIVRNTARSNTPNYNFSGTQVAGPIITGATPIADSISPWANFAW
jgi:hypothetical protein